MTLGRISAIVAIVATFSAPSLARADTATDAFNGWNTSFLAKQNGLTYYATTVITAGTERQGTWVGALDIAVAEDRYMYTHAATDRQLVSDLMTTFVAKEGSTWIKNSSWNDDMAWMIIAGLRAYQIVGNEAWLKFVLDTWNATYDRGWDTKYSGGGIWEDMGHLTPWNKPSKCGLSNNPIVAMGVVLYQITGDKTYLDKSKQIYAWARKTMFVPATGQVYGCVGFATDTEMVGKLEGGQNAYDSGSFVEMADGLYRVTGDDAYHQDAILAVDYRVNKDAIMHDGGRGERQWGYRFTRGLADYCTFNDQWPKYEAWMKNNADAAWSKRNALNITWDDWTKPTAMPGLPGVTHDNDVVALCTSTAAAIWQHFPPPVEQLPSESVELRNVASKLSLTVSGASAPGGAIVQDVFSAGEEFLWTLVPTAGNFYQIRNQKTGLLLAASSGKQGAKIVQTADQGLRPGSDRWLPTKNDDGSYTFYNLSSVFALENPAGTPAAGTQMHQAAGTSAAAQMFDLVLHGEGPTDAGAAKDGGLGDAGTEGGGTVVVRDGGGDQGVADAPNAVASRASGCACRSTGAVTNRRFAAPFALLGVFVLVFRRWKRGIRHARSSIVTR